MDMLKLTTPTDHAGAYEWLVVLMAHGGAGLQPNSPALPHQSQDNRHGYHEQGADSAKESIAGGV